MAEHESLADNRADVMNAPNLMELFCRATAADFRLRARQEVPGLPWISMGACLIMAFVFWSLEQAVLSRIFFFLVVVQTGWTIWVLIIRSGNQIQQQAEDVGQGRFPPEAGPLVTARLRWWNHLVSPRRWARHSRVHGRRLKLKARIEETRERVDELIKADEARTQARPMQSIPVHLRNRVAIEERLQQAQRNPEELARLQDELVVYEALMEQVDEITEKLERIAALNITIRDGPQTDLVQLVADAMAVLTERRELVKQVDAVDPDEFIRMITV